jgi:hypothetical protein
MRSTKLFTVSVAASLVLGAVAHASEAPCLPWGVETLQRVPVPGFRHYPDLHWTSVIGMGTAAPLGSGVGSFQRVPLMNAQYNPERDWTSTIGTGAAASAKR